MRKVNQQVCRDRYQQLQNLTNADFPITPNMLCAGLGGKCSTVTGGLLNIFKLLLVSDIEFHITS